MEHLLWAHTLHVAYLQISKSKPYHLTTIIIMSILQMNKLRSRDIKSLAEVYSLLLCLI